MAYNLGKIKKLVEKPTGVEDLSDIVRHVNKAQRNLAVESNRVKKAEVSVTNGYFSQPDNCLLIKNIYYNGYPLEQYEYDIFPDEATGTPLYWLRDTETINQVETPIVRLYPSPADNSIAKLAFIERPADLIEDDDLPFFADSEEYLIAYAIWRVFAEDDELGDDAIKWKSVADEEKSNWLKMNGVQNSRPRRVRVSPYR